MEPEPSQEMVTHELLEAGKSPNGGWPKKQLALLGVPWPLKRGWKRRVIGKFISVHDADKFRLWHGRKLPIMT